MFSRKALRPVVDHKLISESLQFLEYIGSIHFLTFGQFKQYTCWLSDQVRQFVHHPCFDIHGCEQTELVQTLSLFNRFGETLQSGLAIADVRNGDIMHVPSESLCAP